MKTKQSEHIGKLVNGNAFFQYYIGLLASDMTSDGPEADFSRTRRGRGSEASRPRRGRGSCIFFKARRGRGRQYEDKARQGSKNTKILRRV